MGFWRRMAIAALAMVTAISPMQAEPGDLPPLPTPPPQAPLSQQPVVHVKAFVFQGHTAFSSEELAAVVAPYTGRDLTAEDLEKARVAVTQHYVNKGYINSGAVLPDQTIDDGVVRMTIVEGRLDAIHVRGNKHLRTIYLQPRVAQAGGPPLNIVELRDRLELLRQHPVIGQLNAELKPGSEPGSAELDLLVREENPLQLGLEFANDRPPSVGAERFYLLAWHQSLTGLGDPIHLRYGLTTGGFDDMEMAGIDEIDLAYALPVTAYDTTLLANYTRSNTLIIEDQFQDLDIQSEVEAFTLGLRQPLYRTASREFAVGLAGDYQVNNTSLGGVPFPLSPGAESDGRMATSVIRFSQEWLDRDDRQALALRSTFSFGIDAFNATINPGEVPDSEFFAWLGQGQYVRRLFDTQNLLVLRGAVQLADQRLLALEQLSMGGMDTIRGYRENQVVRDQGALGTIETRLPLIFNTQGQGIFHLVPFVDGGLGWDSEEEQAINMASAGVGVLFNPDRRVNVTVFWGYAFRDFDTPEDNAQDKGLHFNVTLLLF